MDQRLDLEKGDVVFVDMEVVKRERIPPWPRWDAEGVVEAKCVGNGNSPELEWGGKSQFVHTDLIKSTRVCKEHKSRKIYHDKREEWYCPFCEEE